MSVSPVRATERIQRRQAESSVLTGGRCLVHPSELRAVKDRLRWRCAGGPARGGPLAHGRSLSGAGDGTGWTPCSAQRPRTHRLTVSAALLAIVTRGCTMCNAHSVLRGGHGHHPWPSRPGDLLSTLLPALARLTPQLRWLLLPLLVSPGCPHFSSGECRWAGASWLYRHRVARRGRFAACCTPLNFASRL